MSRRRNALVAVAFTYAQSVLGILASFFITRLLVRTLGADLYGTWLATGGLLGYAALADLGIFGVMPWLFAEADGVKDSARKRELIANGLLAGAGAGLLYTAVAGGVWLLLPRLAHLDVQDIARLRGPIVVVVLTTALGYPLRLFSALRSGLQDFKFLGTVQVASTLANAALTYTLLRSGLGLYSVAIASGVLPILTSICALVRTIQLDRTILYTLPRPSLRGTRPILTSGTGGWMAALGWQMAAATDSIVIAYLGYRQLVPTFAITSRLGLTLMQFAWTLPDSALIGLASLGAEGDRARTADVVQSLIRLTLIPVGAIACVTFATNSAFVRLWVGADLFGGELLNALLVLDVVVLSVVHALITPAAVLGNRVQTGIATLANGAAHVVFALVLGGHFGLLGVAAATAMSALFTTIPVGARLLEAKTGITVQSAFGSLVLPWAWRALPCVLLASGAGWAITQSRFAPGGRIAPIILAGSAAALIVAAYLWSVRTMIKDLPFGPRLTRLLSAVGLLPTTNSNN